MFVSKDKQDQDPNQWKQFWTLERAEGFHHSWDMSKWAETEW